MKNFNSIFEYSKIKNFLSIPILLLLVSLSSCCKETDNGQTTQCATYSGEWVGKYKCTQGTTGVTLSIEQEDCDLYAIFTFYDVPENPSLPTGSFNMVGQVSSDGSYTLDPTDWISRPDGWFSLPMSGRIATNNNDQMVAFICNNETTLYKN